MLISETSKKSESVTSSASDTKEEFRSSQSLNVTNTGTRFPVEVGTGKVICWSDAEATVIYMISGLTLDHWNSKAHFFHYFCSLTKSFNKSFAKVCGAQFHINI